MNWDDVLILFNALLIIAAIMVSIFVFLGPLFEMLFDLFMPNDYYEEEQDDE